MVKGGGAKLQVEKGRGAMPRRIEPHRRTPRIQSHRRTVAFKTRVLDEVVVRIKVAAIRKSWDVPVRRMEVLDGHRRLESVGGGRAGGGATELRQIGGQAGPGAPTAGLW